MRKWLVAAGLLAAGPAHAGWSVDYRAGLSSGVDSDGASLLQLDQNVAFSPLAVGPKLETATHLDLEGGARLSRMGLGVRQDLVGGFSVAGHGLLLTRFGPEVDYRSGLGLQGVVDWDVLKATGFSLGLRGYGGATPTEDPIWWAGGGLVLHFGN